MISPRLVVAGVSILSLSYAPLANANELTRISKTHEVWIDANKKRVVVSGKICLRKGVLEMFACPQQTKEHESIVAVNSNASMVHAALLAVGAKAGKPVTYAPEYKAATGQRIRIDVIWKDDKGVAHKLRAQDMIRGVKSKKPMQHDWVFAGSQFWKDPETGDEYYQAEGGELICVSNFSTATMDLPVESTQSTSGLLFEALTENIPPVGTKVRLILTPVQAETKEKPKEQIEKKVTTKIRKEGT